MITPTQPQNKNSQTNNTARGFIEHIFEAIYERDLACNQNESNTVTRIMAAAKELPIAALTIMAGEWLLELPKEITCGECLPRFRLVLLRVSSRAYLDDGRCTESVLLTINQGEGND